MNVLIVEDEPLMASHLQLVVEGLGYAVVGAASTAEAALALVRSQPPDLVLMDINIDGAYDGVETAISIRELHQCPIIFITARYDEQSFLRASRLGPANFLLKPFEDNQVRRAIQLASSSPAPVAAAPPEEDAHFYVKVGHKLRKIAIAEIHSVVADGHYCAIHTQANRYLIRMSFQEVQERLPAERFLKTHRSYLVNEQYVESVDLRDSEIILTNGQRVPLAKREREAFLRRVDKFK
ncbi:response regulator transcription factor [Neolewinella lacunae]|uniref:Response regulator transcription factor n=1 Tax=Neolewinella lacunae TaxID=1517758 RepID=A0A923PJ09_9BACT|nr:response regulator transcription factor [Neolewinella lacunae]MBC6995033.1 response regulator transcription factor [Neolewinella lacunae]MDN3633196.1 response regulator transcription factor [Neolewinella lacunae]